MNASTRATMRSVIRLGVFAGFDFPGELVNRGERLTFAANEAVGLREHLVFDTDAGDAALLQLANEATHELKLP